jgi:hypothetical protein
VIGKRAAVSEIVVIKTGRAIGFDDDDIGRTIVEYDAAAAPTAAVTMAAVMAAAVMAAVMAAAAAGILCGKVVAQCRHFYFAA